MLSTDKDTMAANLLGNAPERPRLLVAINSYGDGHSDYLSRLISEYSSMPFQTHIVVLSNVPKDLGPTVEVIVGLPTKNPWSLPFGHKRIFADRVNDYDLFIYTEDDILITQRNIRAFLQISPVLRDNEVAGFFRKEVGSDGVLHFPEAHGPFRWNPQSVRSLGEYTVAFFTNEHAACYILTQRQLSTAIASGRFLVAPHEGRYDMLCSAATDPYTQCGLKKLIAISHFDDFLVHHIPNKYVDKYGLLEPAMRLQIKALSKIGPSETASIPLFSAETKLPGARYSQNLYESVRDDLVALIPPESQSVLSLGCGLGAMETRLVAKGLRVVAVPMDSIISAGAEAQGVEIVSGDFEATRRKLDGQRFDCLLLLNMLHLIEDPVRLLLPFKEILSENATVIATVPNLSRPPVMLQRLRRSDRVKGLGDFGEAGVHVTSKRTVRSWFKRAGLNVTGITAVLTPRFQRVSDWTRGLADPLLANEFVIVARRA
jgi:2-polyprenyl-3-methyl-5-hydroxy-6-metoxy-1,4-benzoquinol methylase